MHFYNSGIFRTLEYSEPEPYSEPWYIQKPDIFRTLSYWETYQTSDEAFCENGKHNISFSHSLLYEKYLNFLMQVKFLLQKHLIDVKKYGTREDQGSGTVNFWYTYCWCIQIISTFGADNSFGLRKQFIQKSWTKLFKILLKSLKITCKWIPFQSLQLYICSKSK